MSSILTIQNLNKTYPGGFQALKDINLEIKRGEIFALLGPNGAGKTTLIGCVCGVVKPSSGEIRVDGYDIEKDFRKTRALTGLVPQELTVEMFEPVINTVNFSRGLFGMQPDSKHIETVLKKLSLWEKRNKNSLTLSGGMKRRVMIAKALSHEPKLLFLDEPTAGVDVELRKNMWEQVKELKSLGVTIILTTHYIEEAEEMADRVGVMRNGEIVIVDDKTELMKKFGQKKIILELNEPLEQLPSSLASWGMTLSEDKRKIYYSYDAADQKHQVSELLAGLYKEGIRYSDIQTDQKSLEEIFVQLVHAS